MVDSSVLPIFYALMAGVASGSAAFSAYGYLSGRSRLAHSINRGLCVGCDKCVQRCPTQVLALGPDNKARVVNARDCIECRQCEMVCKPQALVMHRRSESPPEIERPDLDEAYQVRDREGMYLVGHAAGVPMVKNAVNLGRAVVEHLVRSLGFRPLSQLALPERVGITADVDVAIVGSGPAGLSAALSCAEKGLRYLVFERSSFTNSTVQCYPEGKDIHSVPSDVRCLGLLPMPDDYISKIELAAGWQERLEQGGVLRFLVKPAQVAAIESVADRGADQGPRFLLRVENLSPDHKGERRQTYRAQRVILAIGEAGPKRPLDIPGEGLPLVRDALSDAAAHRRQRIVVIGGGDSAIEAALQLSTPALDNRVALLVRKRRSDLKASLRNQELLERRIRQGQLLVLYECIPVEILPGQIKLDLRQEKRQRTLDVDVVFKLIGNEQATDWLRRQGVRFVYVRQDRVRSQPTDLLIEQIVGKPVDSNQSLAVQSQERQIDVLAAQLLRSRVRVDETHNRLVLPEPGLLLRPLEPARDAELSAAARERKTIIMKRRVQPER